MNGDVACLKEKQQKFGYHTKRDPLAQKRDTQKKKVALAGFIFVGFCPRLVKREKKSRLSRFITQKRVTAKGKLQLGFSFRGFLTRKK